MSLFISNENQNLLFEMIHKTPEIRVFSTTDEKNNWFRGIIAKFYGELPPTITRDVLMNVNRKVLSYMVSSLKSYVPPGMEVTNNISRPVNVLKKEQPIEPKEYTSFFDIPKPQTIDFSEKLDDEVITNMGELIEQQKKMRERELQEYAPPPPVVSPSTPPNMPIQKPSLKINILEDLPKSIIPFEKHVQFEDKNDLYYKKIDIIEEKLDKLLGIFQIREPILEENPGVNIIKKLLLNS